MSTRFLTNPITKTTPLERVTISDATELEKLMPPALSPEIRARAAFNHWFDRCIDRSAQLYSRRFGSALSQQQSKAVDSVLELLDTKLTLIERTLHSEGRRDYRSARSVDLILDCASKLLDEAARPKTFLETVHADVLTFQHSADAWLNQQLLAFGKSFVSWARGIIPSETKSSSVTGRDPHLEIASTGTSTDRSKQLSYWQQIVENIGDDTPQIEVTYRGPVSAGTVYHVRQTHPPRSGVMAPGTVKSVADVQGAILKFLLNKRAIDVFREEFSSTVDSQTLGYTLAAADDRELFASTKDSFNPASFTPAQSDALVRRGADNVYWRLTPLCTLHRTITRQESEAISGSTVKDKSFREALTMHAREAIAMREVSTFLRDNPGKDAFVVYGSHHEFGPEDFIGVKSVPTIANVSWPGLELKHWASATLLLMRLKDFPELHKRLIEKADRLAPIAFDVLDEAGQWRLLSSGKLQIASTPQQRHRDLAILEARAKSPAIRAAIARMALFD